MVSDMHYNYLRNQTGLTAFFWHVKKRYKHTHTLSLERQKCYRCVCSSSLDAVETITRGLFVWSFTEIILQCRKRRTLLNHMLKKKNPHIKNLKWAFRQQKALSTYAEWLKLYRTMGMEGTVLLSYPKFGLTLQDHNTLQSQVLVIDSPRMTLIINLENGLKCLGQKERKRVSLLSWVGRFKFENVVL